jgi:hypothetical protein
MAGSGHLLLNEPISRSAGTGSPRAASERIANLIPKRNIETWILCLTNRDVDEEEDYRHDRGVDEQIVPAANTFYDWSRANFNAPGRCVLSLKIAISKANRIE